MNTNPYAMPINKTGFTLTSPADEFAGLRFIGKDAVDKFLRIQCPCGVVDTFSLNGIPTIDTPHSCGHPKHWAIKYEGEAQ